MPTVTLRHAALPAALLLLGLTQTAHAQVDFYTNDATINSRSINGSAIVGYANIDDFNNRTNPTSPTVNLGSGGSINTTFLANSSTLNFNGGDGVILFAQ